MLGQKSYTVRRFATSDVASITKLLNIVFKPTIPFTEEWWNWKYAKNPFGFWGEQGDIWVAEDNGQIVGHYAVIPYKMKVDDIIVLAGQSVDTAVHPDYRRLGIFECLAQKVYAGACNRYAFLFGFPSDMAYKGFLKLGWTEQPVDELLKFHNYSHSLKSFIPNRFYVWGGVIFLKTWNTAKSVSSITNLFRQKGEDVIVERISIFGQEFETFWQTKRKEEKVVVERTVSFLNWRFAKPFGDYTVWAGRSAKDGRVLGYCVLKRTQYGNLKNALSIVDLCALANQDKFVQAAVNMCFKEPNVDLVRVRLPGDHTYAKSLSTRGFIEVSKFLKRFGVYQPPLILYNFNGKCQAPRICHWFYSLTDTDYA